MGPALLSLLTVGVMIYAAVDCWRSPAEEVQRLTRPGWLIIIVLVPLVGGLAYLTLGRTPAPRPGEVSVDGKATGGRGTGLQPAPARGPSRTLAPDDDPEFLRTLDFQRRLAAAQERRRREADEKRRTTEQKADHRAEHTTEQRGEAPPEPADPARDEPAGDDPPS